MHLITTSIICRALALAAAISAIPTLKNSSSSSSKQAVDIYTFPANTWIENIAITPNNDILATQLLPSAAIYRFNATSQAQKLAPEVLLKLDEVTSILGITESLVDKDLFYFIGLNFTLSPEEAFDNNRIYSFRIPSHPQEKATVKILTKFPLDKDKILLNGLTTLNTNTLLAADSLGIVYSIDTLSGQYKPVLTGPAYAPGKSIGVNGIRVLFPGERLGNQTYLYFTNTGAQSFSRVSIDALTGAATGNVQQLATSSTGYDDFALDQETGDAYLVTQGGNSVQKVAFDGIVTNGFVAGNNTQGVPIVDCGTSAAIMKGQQHRWGAGRKKLIVTTNGGLGCKTTPVGGQIVEVDL